MSSKRHDINQNNISLGFKEFSSSINYKSVIKNIYTIFIYVILIIFFKFTVELFLRAIIASEKLNISNLFLLIVIYFLNIAVLAKIISVRMKWTLFIKRSKILSWKQTLFRYFPILLPCTFSCIIGIYEIHLTILQIMSSYDAHFWANPKLVAIAVIFLIGNYVFSVEILFYITFLFDKSIYLIFNKTNQFKGNKFEKSKIHRVESGNISEFRFPNLWTFQVTNSKIVLVGVLTVLIFFSKLISEQIDNYFLAPASFDLGILLYSALLALLLFTHFIISLNTMVFKHFKWEPEINIKSKILILFFSFFVFINWVYFAKYLSIAMFYYPVDKNDPATTIFLSNMIMPSGKKPLEDSFFIALGTLLNYITIAISSATLAYLVFFAKTSKNHTMKILENIKKYILQNDDKESDNFLNPISKATEKLFSKQFKNPTFVKYFSLFYYIYVLGMPFLISLTVLYLVVYDDMFGTSRFSITVNKYLYVLGICFFLNIVFTVFLGQAQKHYQYHLSYFISKNTWRESVKYIVSIYSPIVGSSLVSIFMRNVYRISKEYGNIAAPESIQALQSIFFSVFVFGYLFISISSKLENFLTNIFEICPRKNGQIIFDNNYKKDDDYENLKIVKN
jgi:hypothetical protein